MSNLIWFMVKSSGDTVCGQPLIKGATISLTEADAPGLYTSPLDSLLYASGNVLVRATLEGKVSAKEEGFSAERIRILGVADVQECLIEWSELLIAIAEGKVNNSLTKSYVSDAIRWFNKDNYEIHEIAFAINHKLTAWTVGFDMANAFLKRRVDEKMFGI